jgi:hypothetical protein
VCGKEIKKKGGKGERERERKGEGEGEGGRERWGSVEHVFFGCCTWYIHV